ncbi:MAG: OmpA family protein, partial [Hyphomicrobiaceae bacterium]
RVTSWHVSYSNECNQVRRPERSKMQRNTFAMVVLGGFLIASAHAASAQSRLSAEQEAMLNALTCQAHHACGQTQRPRTRGFGASRPRKRNFRFQRDDRLQKKESRDEIEQMARQGKLPSIEKEILFAYDSARLRPAAQRLLKQIGEVLSHPRLARYKFALVGHTDAKGSAAYNQDLSERRARSARAFLLDFFDISRSRITAYGRGEAALKRPDEPYSGRNRRVQFVNLGATATN